MADRGSTQEDEPRRRSLRWRIERSGDADAAGIWFGRPATGRPCGRKATQGLGVRNLCCDSLKNYVGVANRDGDRTTGIESEIAILPGSGACLEPECRVEPDRTDGSHVRAAVLVYRDEPLGASVVRVWRRRRTRVKVLYNCRPVDRWQPVGCAQVDDLHGVVLPQWLRPEHRPSLPDWGAADRHLGDRPRSSEPPPGNRCGPDRIQDSGWHYRDCRSEVSRAGGKHPARHRRLAWLLPKCSRRRRPTRPNGRRPK